MGSFPRSVHKVIVCTQSKVFRAACSKPFKEAASGEYEIAEQSPAMVRRMVDYFYTGDYTYCSESPQDLCQGKPEHSDEEAFPEMRVHARMFALAEMYQVDGLRTLAVTKYGEATVGAKSPSIQELLDSIPDIYQLTPSSVRLLRDKVVVTLRAELGRATRRQQVSVSNHTEAGDQSGGGVDTLMAVYDKIAAESPEFLKDLLSSYIRMPSLGRCSHCGSQRPQPTEPIQLRCLTCGKGGASEWSNATGAQWRWG